VLNAGAVPGFEFVNERKVHPADESNLLAFADQRGEGSRQKRSFLFPELQRRQVGRRRDGIAGRIDAHGIVDSRERGVRVFPGELCEIVGEDEADSHHEVHAFRGEQSQPGLAIRPIAGFDEADVRAKILLCPLATEIRAVVERFVPAPAEVEDDADVDRAALGRNVRARRMHEQQRDGGRQQNGHERQQSSHGHGRWSDDGEIGNGEWEMGAG